MLSVEQKSILIKQLERYIGARPFFYLKFCKEQKYAKDICNGNLYVNTPEYFRNLELEFGKKGQGDKNELIERIHSKRAWMIDPNTNEVLMRFGESDAEIRYESDDKSCIFCMTGIPVRDMDILSVDEKTICLRLPFSKDDIKRIEDDCGRYVVLIGARDLELRVKYYFETEGKEAYVFEPIIYCVCNRLDRIRAFVDGSMNRFLYKDECFSFQREYRIATTKEVPDDHYIRIGILKSAKVFMTHELNEFIFAIEYESHLMEEK